MTQLKAKTKQKMLRRLTAERPGRPRLREAAPAGGGGGGGGRGAAEASAVLVQMSCCCCCCTTAAASAEQALSGRQPGRKGVRQIGKARKRRK